MDSAYIPAAVIEAASLRVRVEEHWHTAALRYFDPEGEFARRAAQVLGHALPKPLGITGRGALSQPRSILAWKSPTESLLLSADADRLQQLAKIDADGCCIELTGGRRIVRIEGARGADLLARLGGVAFDPPVEQARTGRLAELPALALRLADDLLLVVVERCNLEHLLRWIELTVCDFA